MNAVLHKALGNFIMGIVRGHDGDKIDAVCAGGFALGHGAVIRIQPLRFLYAPKLPIQFILVFVTGKAAGHEFGLMIHHCTGIMAGANAAATATNHTKF